MATHEFDELRKVNQNAQKKFMSELEAIIDLKAIRACEVAYRTNNSQSIADWGYEARPTVAADL